MKKINLITICLLSIPVFASNFVIVISEDNNNYSSGIYTETVDNPEWTLINTSCENDKEPSDIYYNQTDTQETICIEEFQRIVTTTKTYEDGRIISSTSTENYNNTLDPTYQTITGTHTESSCKNILDNNYSIGDGIYTIYNSKNYEVYCEMTTNGGGWTMAFAQFEADPTYNWNEGIQTDYDPSLVSEKSFSLNSEELPSHSEISYSQSSLDGLSSNNLYFNYTYTTGDIPLSTITDNNGDSYYVHRNINNYYGWHDPDDYSISYYSDWNNTFTISKIETNTRSFDFAYSINQPNQQMRGYCYNGIDYQSSFNSGAWIVWVR